MENKRLTNVHVSFFRSLTKNINSFANSLGVSVTTECWNELKSRFQVLIKYMDEHEDQIWPSKLIDRILSYFESYENWKNAALNNDSNADTSIQSFAKVIVDFYMKKHPSLISSSIVVDNSVASIYDSYLEYVDDNLFVKNNTDIRKVVGGPYNGQIVAVDFGDFSQNDFDNFNRTGLAGSIFDYLSCYIPCLGEYRFIKTKYLSDDIRVLKPYERLRLMHRLCIVKDDNNKLVVKDELFERLVKSFKANPFVFEYLLLRYKKDGSSSYFYAGASSYLI